MKKIYVTIGLPGSGKSTWCEKQNGEIVSSDAMREKIYGDANHIGNPKRIFDAMEHQIYNSQSSTILYDATNLRQKNRLSFLTNMRAHFVNNDVSFIAVVFETPIEECKRRCLARAERIVPPNVIDRMSTTFDPIDAAERRLWDEIITIG